MKLMTYQIDKPDNNNKNNNNNLSNNFTTK